MISDLEKPSVAIKEPLLDPISTQEPTMVCYYVNN